jgi:hypothetical protein
MEVIPIHARGTVVAKAHDVMEVIPIHARGTVVAKAHDVMYVIPIHARGTIVEYVFGCSNHGRKNFWLKKQQQEEREY